MKAIFFDGSKAILRTHYPQPDSGEALVKVKCAGICGTDLQILKGYASYSGVLGHEFVGVVEGPRNSEFFGKRIVGEINVGCRKCKSCLSGLERHCPNRTVLGILNRDGAFADYLSLPERNLHVIPDSIDDSQAVFVEPLAAAFEIKEQVKLEPNWQIAIVGDGRLAQLIARVLNLSSSKITCFGRHDSKLMLLKKIGAKTQKKVFPDSEQKFDLVVEATGNESGFLDSMKLVKPRGLVVLKSTIASQNNLDLSPAVVNEVTVVGSRCGPFNPAIKALATGIISVDDLVDEIYPLDEFDKAIEQSKKSETLKVLLKP